jgi:hypothetical protein
VKKTGFLLMLCWAVSALAQQSPLTVAAPDQTQPTSVSFPMVRITTPNEVDVACAGFINDRLLPNASFVAGGLQTPNTTKFAANEIIYLAGTGYQAGERYEVVRELRDPNRYELFKGQFAMLKSLGQPYAELGRVRIIDTRSKLAIAQVELSCEPIVPGDLVVKYQEKPAIAAHAPLRFDRFLPTSGKTSGRIIMAKDFDGELGTGMKVYMNLGTNQGVKVGEYFRGFRPYEDDLHNAVDSLSFKASTAEDTQQRPASFEQHMFTGTKGPAIHVRDLPRRAMGEIVILNATPTSSTGMIVFALEDFHVGDGVELDQE